MLHHDAAGAIGVLATALGAVPGTGAVHTTLAHGWSVDAAGAELIRRALVLLADHELNASTFAARVAASTGAPVAAPASRSRHPYPDRVMAAPAKRS